MGVEEEKDRKERAVGGGNDSLISLHSYVTESTEHSHTAELTRWPNEDAESCPDRNVWTCMERSSS